MIEWSNRPLDPVYPVIFIDAIMVKVRDGQVRNKPIYVVIGVTVNGERDILGLWAGGGGEGAKFWLQVLTELKNRGVQDVCIAVCDGLKALPDAITTVWELAVVQACIIHLIRNTFRFASRKYWDQIAHDLRPVYTAASEAEALARLGDLAWACALTPSARSGQRCRPALIAPSQLCRISAPNVTAWSTVRPRLVNARAPT